MFYPFIKLWVLWLKSELVRWLWLVLMLWLQFRSRLWLGYARLGLNATVINVTITYMAAMYMGSAANCAAYVVSLHYTYTQHRAHASDQRAILRSCSNVNNDEEFRDQSLQQLQYRAVQ